MVLPHLPRHLQDLLARRAPVLAEAAPALDGGMGVVLPHLHEGRGPHRADHIEEALRVSLGTEPSSRVPWYEMPLRGVDRNARTRARHEWLVPLAMGEPAIVGLAVDAWRRWLWHDRPGNGPEWVHTTDLAARLIHWALALAWLGPSADAQLRRDVAGSVALHLEHLRLRLAPIQEGDPRRPLQLAGLIVGALVWPFHAGLGNPRERTSIFADIGALAAAVGAQLAPDGFPRLRSPALLAEIASHILVARQLAVANRLSIPRDLDLVLCRILGFLDVVAEDGRDPPEMGAPCPFLLLPLDRRPRASSLSDAGRHLGFLDGRPGPGASGDLFFRTLFGTSPALAPLIEPGPSPSRWDVRTWHESGCTIARSAGGFPSRLVFDAGIPRGVHEAIPSPMQVLWSVGGREILAEAGYPSVPDSHVPVHGGLRIQGLDPLALSFRTMASRAEEDQVRLVARSSFRRDHRTWTHERRVILWQGRMRADRLEILDRLEGSDPVSIDQVWLFGPDLALSPPSPDVPTQGEFDLVSGDLHLHVRLDPSLRLRVETGTIHRSGSALSVLRLVGRGVIRPGQILRSEFGLR